MTPDRTDTYYEFGVNCTDGLSCHAVGDPRSLTRASFYLGHLDRDFDCGPHYVVKRKVVAYYEVEAWQRIADDELPITAEVARKRAESYPCGKCGVDVGESCISLNSRNKNRVAIKWPHQGRDPEMQINLGALAGEVAEDVRAEAEL